MYQINIKAKLQCPKKHRYNPDKDGLSFHSACRACAGMHDIWMKVVALEQELRAWQWEHGKTPVEKKVKGLGVGG